MGSGRVGTGSLSVSTGDYLKAIWTVSGGGAVSTKEISGHLSVAPASVTNALVRLREMGFVEYERYHGASLTERGRREALRLVRRHRLIETFLLESLGYTWREVHDEAERLEHAVSDEFTERLAAFLGHPERDPHGDPIPDAEGTFEPDDSFPLLQAAAGEEVSIFKVDDESAKVLEYLGERGLVPGRRLFVRESGRSVLVEDEAGDLHRLRAELAGSVFVRNARE